jgi:DNA adenine methylase
MYEPVVKWSGSKRSQAATIISKFPTEIETYYEPFCGGASVLRRLLSSDIKVKNYVCSDINKGLIDLYEVIKKQPTIVSSYYKDLWTAFNKDNDMERKKAYFNEVRTRYNKTQDPLDFMFIMRTTTNGMPRYNKNGEFNNSLHITRNGIEPQRLDKIIKEWSEILNKKQVEFKCCSYTEIHAKKQDVMYLDPPYANTKGMYYGTIDYAALWEYLRTQECRYYLSFDGISGVQNNVQVIPKDIYTEHVLICSGNSSFKRTIGKDTAAIVYESLYVK